MQEGLGHIWHSDRQTDRQRETNTQHAEGHNLQAEKHQRVRDTEKGTKMDRPKVGGEGGSETERADRCTFKCAHTQCQRKADRQ